MFTENVKRLNEKLTETNKVKMELQLKLDDIQSSETSVQVHIRIHGNQQNLFFPVPMQVSKSVICLVAP